jgi:hypothetical protein
MLAECKETDFKNLKFTNEMDWGKSDELWRKFWTTEAEMVIMLMVTKIMKFMMIIIVIFEISGSHDSEYEDDSLLWYCAV